jgi:hypothetical protein
MPETMSEELFLRFVTLSLERQPPPYRFLWRILRAHSYDTSLVCPAPADSSQEGPQQLTESAIRFLRNALPLSSAANDFYPAPLTVSPVSRSAQGSTHLPQSPDEDRDQDEESAGDTSEALRHVLVAVDSGIESPLDRWLSFWHALSRINPACALV